MKWRNIFLALSVLFIGCQSENEMLVDTNTGISLQLTDEDNEAFTRSAPAELDAPLTSLFQISVTDADTEEEVFSGAFNESILLEEGLYHVTAKYGTNPVIAIDEPYYEGNVINQQVVVGRMTPVTIPCSVANSLLSVLFNAEALGKLYETYYVTVAVGEQSVDLYSATNESAYFRAGSSVNLTFHGVIKGTGQQVAYEIPNQEAFNNVAAKTHVKISLGLDESAISSGAGISIEKLETETVSISETVPLEYLPKPKMQSTGFVDNAISFVETEKKVAQIGLVLSSPLQDLKIKFNEVNPFFQDLEIGKDYLLSNEEDKAKLEAALGIQLPALGSTEGSLDFGTLIPEMLTENGTPVTSVVEIDVKANNRWSSEGEADATSRTFTFTCNKPEFSVIINDGDVWSKEFSIDGCNVTAGDSERILADLTYQYRQSGDGEWLDCEQTVILGTHPENKNYQVRAVYRNAIETAPVDIILETPQQLPNSGMEDWYTEKGETYRVSNSWSKKQTYYRFYLGQSGEDNWWATNSQRSQDGKIILGMGNPVCFAPCVSYSESEKHEGNRSALIYTSGHGGGYASTETLVYSEGAFAGSLFIGSYSWSDGTENMSLGHSFNCRPSSLKFWYNYKPKDADSFKVYIELKNGDEVVGSATYIPAAISAETGWQEAVVDVVYGENPKRATSISVQFLSTTKTSFGESDFNKNMSFDFPIMSGWNIHVGSMLYIDDISLVFDK